jgi:hypothetical protein
MAAGSAGHPAAVNLPNPKASVLVYVIVVLEVAVAVVQVVDMVPMRDLLAVVVLGVSDLMPGVDPGLRVALAVVDVIDVASVHDGLVPVAGQVFMVMGFRVPFAGHGFLRSPVEPKLGSIDNCCQ